MKMGDLRIGKSYYNFEKIMLILRIEKIGFQNIVYFIQDGLLKKDTREYLELKTEKLEDYLGNIIHEK